MKNLIKEYSKLEQLLARLKTGRSKLDKRDRTSLHRLYTTLIHSVHTRMIRLEHALL